MERTIRTDSDRILTTTAECIQLKDENARLLRVEAAVKPLQQLIKEAINHVASATYYVGRKEEDQMIDWIDRARKIDALRNELKKSGDDG